MFKEFIINQNKFKFKIVFDPNILKEEIKFRKVKQGLRAKIHINKKNYNPGILNL